MTTRDHHAGPAGDDREADWLRAVATDVTASPRAGLLSEVYAQVLAVRQQRRRLMRVVPAGVSVLVAAVVAAALVLTGGQSAPMGVDPATGPSDIASTGPAPHPTGPARPCLAGDLGARFQGVSYATGNDFGTVLVWNHADTPCRLAGAVGFSGQYADGATDENATLGSSVRPVDVTLPARMKEPSAGDDASAYLTARFMGSERDDSGQPDGLCRQQDKLAPATLVLMVGDVTLRVANRDPNGYHLPGDPDGVYGCHGYVVLHAVAAPGS